MPVVFPSKIPERISTLSDSFLCVVKREEPGFRRSRKDWMSISFKARPAGQPSTTTPIPEPWDSPQVVILNIFPNVEPDIIDFSFQFLKI